MEKISDEITNEMLENYIANSERLFAGHIVKRLSEMLLEERKQPKVWDGAPEWASAAKIEWTDAVEYENMKKAKHSQTFTRELPKSPIREIAEKVGKEWFGDAKASSHESLYDAIESAINEAMALKA